MANQENLAEMGRAGRVLDTLAKWVRALAEALHAVKPRQGMDNAGSVLDAFLKETAPSLGAERTLRESGVPVDEINRKENAYNPEEKVTDAPSAEKTVTPEGGAKYSTENVDELDVTVRSVRNAVERDGEAYIDKLGGTVLANYMREEPDEERRREVARDAVGKLFNVVPVTDKRLEKASLIKDTMTLPEDEDEVASEYEDAKIVDARNRQAHGGVLVGKSQTEEVVRARAKQVLGKTYKYLFDVYHGTTHAGWTRWEGTHRGTTGLGYAYFAPNVATAADYSDTHDTPNSGLADIRDMQRFGISDAVYHMVVGMNNPLVIDCRNSSWRNIRMKNRRTVSTDEILHVIKRGGLGYDGVIFLNVHDSSLRPQTHGYDVDVVPLGPVGKNGKNGDVAKQMKSLDGMTVSDVNVPEFFGAIDILDRFDVRNPDIRHSTEVVGDDVLSAMDILAQGQDVTLQSNALGEVVYPFGRFGKGGMGFLHIVERRMEQGHTLEEAIEIALRVGEAAARGDKTSEQGNIRWLDRNGHRAVVAINGNDKPIITGYDIYPKESAGDERMPILPPSNSAPIPPGRKEEVVAALKEIVANIRAARGVRHSTEDVGAPRFSETREGKRIVAALVDNLIAHQADLAFGNEALAERLAQKGNAGVGKWNKVTRVSENGAVLPGSAEELAREEAFRAWQFGRPGGEDLKGLVRACGGAANWLDVVGTAYEVLSAIRSENLLGGLNKTVAERFGKNEKEAVGWYVQRIVSARATDFGQKCYLMGRKFATDLMREANASAIAELRREYKGKLSEERGKTRKAKERARGLERTAERRKANLRAAEAKIDFIKAEADLLYSEAMRKIFRSGLALLLAAFAGGGCIWNRAKVNDAGVAARAAAIVPGETRVEALPALMGCEPSAIVPLRDGRVVHVFGYGDAKTEGFTLLLVTFTKTNSAFSAVYVFADAEGVVRRVSAAPAPGVAWETWPFGE